MKELKYCKFCDKEKPIKDFCKSGFAIKNICRECQNKKQTQIYRNSKKVEELLEENKELKNQLEETRKCLKDMYHINIENDKELDKLKTQQKEFTKYLESKIYSIEPKGTSINYNCEYDSEEDYVMAMQEQTKLNTLKEILQKYKEIIGE